jgi:prolyl 4-hydroxylase
MRTILAALSTRSLHYIMMLPSCSATASPYSAHPLSPPFNMSKAKSDEKKTTAPLPSSPVAVPVPVASNGGVSVTTLIALLILSSICSSLLGPFVQHGLKRAAEIYLGVTSPVQLQNEVVVPAVQSRPEPVNLQARSHTEGGLIDPSDYVCKHSYTMRVIHRDPLIMIADDFLQPGEAEHMIAYAKPRMERSRVLGDQKYSEGRTSSSAYLTKSADHVIRCIEERASHITGIPVNTTESLQVVWYTKGQEFRPHFDYISHKNLLTDYWTKLGQRYVTMLVYMNEPEEGGGTSFPTLNLEVKPKKNAAVIWYNVGLDEKEDPRTLHGGSPVLRGEKYAINIWQRKMIPHTEEVLREREAMKAKKQAKSTASAATTNTPVSETPKVDL